MALKIEAAVCSNMGKVRKNNEDNFYFNGLYMDENQRNGGGMVSREYKEPLQIYAVCDGMGGEEGGEDASITAVRALFSLPREYQGAENPQVVKDKLQLISDTIEENARKKGYHSGTTIAMTILNRENVQVFHVGDSRVYRMDGKKLSRMTLDHSEVQRLCSMGIITADQMDTHPKRHMITQYLGMPRGDGLLSPGVSREEPLKDGERYLLCSDGLTDMVKDPEIEAILGKAKTAEEAVKQLTLAALKNGGRDNVTTICLFVRREKEEKSSVSKLKLKMYAAIAGMVIGAGMMLTSIALMLMNIL